MERSIFTIPISQLEIKDIASFCNHGFSEGLRIEYKKDFPKNLKLVETICAFANTQGGIILIGVKADTKQNKPKIITGIELKDGLEEKIISSCLSHISPSITPEVKVVDYKSEESKTESDKAVLFIRVRTSYIAPHYLLNNNQIPIRVHCKNALADLQTIENLIKKREDITSDYSSTNPFCDMKKIGINCVSYETIKIIPQFHQVEPIIDFYYKEASDWLLKTTNEVMTLSEQRPELWELKFFSKNQSTKEITRICAITRSGGISFQHSANVENSKYDPLESIRLIVKIMKNAKKIYNRFGFFGELRVGLTLTAQKNLLLSFANFSLDEKYEYKTATLKVSKNIRYDDLSNPKEMLEDFLKEICIHFGLILPEKNVGDMIQEILSDTT